MCRKTTSNCQLKQEKAWCTQTEASEPSEDGSISFWLSWQAFVKKKEKYWAGAWTKDNELRPVHCAMIFFYQWWSYTVPFTITCKPHTNSSMFYTNWLSIGEDDAYAGHIYDSNHTAVFINITKKFHKKIASCGRLIWISQTSLSASI